MECDTCKSTFVISGSDGGICAACPANCLECRESNGAMVCSKCKHQYVVMDDETCSGEYQSIVALKVSERHCTKSIGVYGNF